MNQCQNLRYLTGHLAHSKRPEIPVLSFNRVKHFLPVQIVRSVFKTCFPMNE